MDETIAYMKVTLLKLAGASEQDNVTKVYVKARKLEREQSGSGISEQ
jgi:hypothetical protein